MGEERTDVLTIGTEMIQWKESTVREIDLTREREEELTWHEQSYPK